MSQCFFGILPWSEIMNYLSICMLYPADYLVYYFSSLLQHCQTQLLSHVVNGKLWPENLVRYYKPLLKEFFNKLFFFFQFKI